MGVEEEDAAEDGVEGGVEGARGEGGDGQGNEAGGEEALEGPVVGAVGGAGLRNGGRVVDCERVSVYHVKPVCDLEIIPPPSIRSAKHVSTSLKTHWLYTGKLTRTRRENGTPSGRVVESSNTHGLHEDASGRDGGGSGPSRSQGGLPKQRGTHN